ncbi:hypothetical protein [Roseovarius aestuariivivens]|uniref:hypothetical protein n=1 Tax=Roseovarius aestuariivivens TaxID=1888910 RepID=UPI0010800922|nr:hypothetical protein [Roseovarius aestuariivivens]
MKRFADLQPLVLAVFLLSLIPAVALANVPIFFVFATVRVTLWWTVLVAIAIEAVVLWAVFDMPARRAGLAAILVNIGTAALGFVIYPAAGLAVYPLLAPVVSEVFGAGDIVEIAAYCVAAAVIDTPVELALLAGLSRAAGYGLRFGWQRAGAFFLANLLSAAVLFAALQVEVRTKPVSEATKRILASEMGAQLALADDVFAALPAHVDAAGVIDPDWAGGIAARARDLGVLELTVGTGADFVTILRAELPPIGYGLAYTYEEDQRYGDATVTRGTIRRHENRDPVGGEVREVVHYQKVGGCGAFECFLRAVLPWPGPGSVSPE